MPDFPSFWKMLRKGKEKLSDDEEEEKSREEIGQKLVRQAFLEDLFNSSR